MTTAAWFMFVVVAMSGLASPGSTPLTIDDLVEALGAVGHPRLWPTECEDEMPRDANAEAILKNYPANAPAIREEPGEDAVYFILFDLITMPTPSDSCTLGMYYHTLYHELAHSTRHNHRLGRHIEYADEEIVAELAAIVLARQTRFESDLRHTKHVLDRYRATESDLRRLWPEATKAASYILARTSAESIVLASRERAPLAWAHLDPRIVTTSGLYPP